jgi:Icc-related predicted phosphoesterase
VRVQILSDLHFEFDEDGGEAFAHDVPVVGDVLVLAGDLLPMRSIEDAKRAFGWFCGRFPHVVFLPGNHEYYRTSPANAEAVLTACAKSFANLHVLNPRVATIDGTRFVGAALWFPPTPDETKFRRLMNDFRLIEGFVPWVHETHAAHLTFLRMNIQRGDVVVTHYLPHPRSVAPQFAGSPLNRFFLAEDTTDLVERAGARLWIHGHTHAPCDYVVGETRVVCNPRGYPQEANHPIDVGFVVEV